MGTVIHTGFKTYALVILILFVIISFIEPDVADSILMTISNFSKAVQGV